MIGHFNPLKWSLSQRGNTICLARINSTSKIFCSIYKFIQLKRGETAYRRCFSSLQQLQLPPVLYCAYIIPLLKPMTSCHGNLPVGMSLHCPEVVAVFINILNLHTYDIMYIHVFVFFVDENSKQSSWPHNCLSVGIAQMKIYKGNFVSIP